MQHKHITLHRLILDVMDERKGGKYSLENVWAKRNMMSFYIFFLWILIIFNCISIRFVEMNSPSLNIFFNALFWVIRCIYAYMPTLLWKSACKRKLEKNGNFKCNKQKKFVRVLQWKCWYLRNKTIQFMKLNLRCFMFVAFDSVDVDKNELYDET